MSRWLLKATAVNDRPRDRSCSNRLFSLFLFPTSPAPGSAGFRRKVLGIAPVLTETSPTSFSVVRPPFPESKPKRFDFRFRVRSVLGSRFRPLPAIFRGMSKNKSDSKWGFTPRIGSLAGGLEFFRSLEITQGTHALPARGPGHGPTLGPKVISWSS
ncbi:unnamed protein product [Prunus armeniaca]